MTQLTVADSVIVFQPEGRPVAILTPCECGLTLQQIGEKDVPAGMPFWIVPAAELPADETYRDAWRLDPGALGSPSGVGGGN